MLYRISFFILLLLNSFVGSACDSIRVALKYYQESGSPALWEGVIIDTIKDNQIISSTDYICDAERNIIFNRYTPYQWDSLGLIISRKSPDHKNTYTYDSLARLITDEDSVLVGSTYEINSKKEYHFTSTNKKTEFLEYRNQQQGFGIYFQERWFYDSLDRQTEYQKSEIVNGVFHLSELKTSLYTTAFTGFSRLDSVFTFSNNALHFSQLFAYDKIGDTLSYVVWSSSSIPPDLNTMFIDDHVTITNQCGYTSVSGGVEHWFHWDTYRFDENCRMLNYDHGYSGMSTATSNGVKYFYGSCDSMVLFFNADKKTICRGDTIHFSNYIFGGTPPYTFTWNQTGAFNNDSIINPFAMPQSSGNFKLTVTDAHGNSISDSVNIQVSHLDPVNISITTIDTTDACSSVDITINATIGNYYSWEKDGQFYPTYTTYPLHIIRNGIYTVTGMASNCPGFVTDSIDINFLHHPPPTCSIIQGCNQLFASSSTANNFEWFSNSGFVAIGNPFNYFTDGLYKLYAIDSAGCRSEPASLYVQRFFIEPDFGLSCNDDCQGFGRVNVFPFSNDYRFNWSNGDTTSSTNHLCTGIISVAVINNKGCVITAADTCPGFNKPISAWEVYPIPSQGKINIETNNTGFPFQYDITDMLGKKIFSGEIIQRENSIELNDYRKGIYILKISKGDEDLYVNEIVLF